MQRDIILINRNLLTAYKFTSYLPVSRENRANKTFIILLVWGTGNKCGTRNLTGI